MIILALDLGTKCGWAVAGGSSGVATFATRDSVHPALRHGRLGWRFAGWLGDMLYEHGPDVVAVEEMVARSLKGEAARVLLGLRMSALSICHAHNVAIEEINGAEWKRWVRRAGYDWSKGDQSDARAIAAYYAAVRVPVLEAAE